LYQIAYARIDSDFLEQTGVANRRRVIVYLAGDLVWVILAARTAAFRGECPVVARRYQRVASVSVERVGRASPAVASIWFRFQAGYQTSTDFFSLNINIGGDRGEVFNWK